MLAELFAVLWLGPLFTSVLGFFLLAGMFSAMNCIDAWGRQDGVSSGWTWTFLVIGVGVFAWQKFMGVQDNTTLVSFCKTLLEYWAVYLAVGAVYASIEFIWFFVQARDKLKEVKEKLLTSTSMNSTIREEEADRFFGSYGPIELKTVDIRGEGGNLVGMKIKDISLDKVRLAGMFSSWTFLWVFYLPARILYTWVHEFIISVVTWISKAAKSFLMSAIQ